MNDSCAKCGKQITSDNRNEFIRKEDKWYCSSCLPENSSQGSPLESFETLRNTTFILRRSDSKYNKADSIKEKIDIYEKNLGKRVFPKFFLIALLGGILLGAVIYFLFFSNSNNTPGSAGSSSTGRNTAGSSVSENGPGTADTSKSPEYSDKGSQQHSASGQIGQARLEELKKAVVKDEASLVKLRDRIARAYRETGNEAFSELLIEVDARISFQAEKEIKGLREQVDLFLKENNFEEARGAVNEFRSRYSNTDWYSTAGGAENITILEQKLQKAVQQYVAAHLKKAKDLRSSNKYIRAYSEYEKALSSAPADKKAEIERQMQKLISESGEHFGGRGLEEYIEDKKYFAFRQKYLYYIRIRDLKVLRELGEKCLKAPEFKAISEKIRKDIKDIELIEELMKASTSYFKRFMGKDYVLQTQAGPVRGTINGVENGIISMNCSDVMFTLPVSRLAVKEFMKIAGDSKEKRNRFNLALGILYLAGENVKKALIRFKAAEGNGVDIERYMEHIKAFQNDKKEKEASDHYKKIEDLMNMREWERLADYLVKYRKRWRGTLFYAGHVAQMEKFRRKARLNMENSITLSEKFLPGPDFTGCMDTVLDGRTSESRRRNFGAAQYLKASGDKRLVSLIKYDLSDIPSHSRIFSAELSLFCKEIENTKTDTRPFCEIYRVTQDWKEGYKHRGRPEVGATWFEPEVFNGVRTKEGNWKVYGGTYDAASDFGNGPGGVIDKQYIAPKNCITFNVTTMIRKWVSGKLPNYGFIVRSGPDNGRGSNTAHFFSADYTGDYSKHPRLFIHYKGSGEYNFSRFAFEKFDGYPGHDFCVSSKDRGCEISSVLIRDTAPNRAERKVDWRGRVGTVNKSLNRVLIECNDLISAVPPNSVITQADLHIPVIEAASKKKILNSVYGA